MPEKSGSPLETLKVKDSMVQSASASNSPEYSVSELSTALKRTVEDAFAHVRVRGEISGYRGPHSSGHVYFTLKDQNAKIDAIIWKGTFSRLKSRPEEGLEVIATGKLSTFPGKSSYQIIIEAMEPAGIGALLAQLEERKKRLAAEGLFDADRKRPLPYLPRTIGVITSPTGAVIRDILHRLSDRFPTRVLVWPVRVQGETSAAEVAAAIEGFNALTEHGAIPRPDVLIVARGGGSLEDLWSFNEEIVVRAAAASVIPLISAVGHETDTTLIDFASDRRAPTPTGAAEMAVPVRAELLAQTRSLSARLANGIQRNLENRKNALRALTRVLPQASELLATPRQRLDYLSSRLTPALLNTIQKKRLHFIKQAAQLQHNTPANRLSRTRDRLAHLSQRMAQAQKNRTATLHHRLTGTANRLTPRLVVRNLHQKTEKLNLLTQRHQRITASIYEPRRKHLQNLSQLLNAFSYQGVLERGFALVRDEKGTPLRSTTQTHAGMALSMTLADGTVSVHVDTGTRPAPSETLSAPSKASSKPRKPDTPPLQGKLF